MTFEYTITGDAVVLQKLRTLEQVITNAAPLEDVAKAALPALRIYPAELPNQKYVRTEDLKRGWQYGAPMASANGKVIHLFNPVDYAPPVYSDTSQAPIHQDRWKTRSELRDQIAPDVIAAFHAWVKGVLGR